MRELIVFLVVAVIVGSMYVEEEERESTALGSADEAGLFVIVGKRRYWKPELRQRSRRNGKNRGDEKDEGQGIEIDDKSVVENYNS
ncbi:hypothetical protein ACHWQZ_G004590 [Mnemiopsis leidyi]